MATLRVLATSDLHMHIAAHDYHSDLPNHRRGLALTAALIAQARSEVPSSVLFDNGDFLQGSPLGDFVAKNGFHPHPMVQAMGYLRYDAVNIGNHEFSHGFDVLMQALADAPFPCLATNTVAAPDHPRAGVFQPWAIVHRQLACSEGQSRALRIGVMGVLPSETAIWDKQAIGGRVQMAAMTPAVAEHLPALRAAGADIIVVLAHCGFDTGTDVDEGAMGIAAVPGVDAVVMGHLHNAFPGPDAPAHPGVDAILGTVGGKPAVMPGAFGSHLGLIDLDLAHGPQGWKVIGHRVEARAVTPPHTPGRHTPHLIADPGIEALIAPLHHATRIWARQPISRTPRPIHSYLAHVADCVTTRLINQAQAAHVANQLHGGPHGDLPVLSATAPYKTGGLGGADNFVFIPAGDVLLRHAVDLYPYPNTVMALRLTGAALRLWLERSVQGFCTITPKASDQPLINPNVPSFLFDTVFGLTYDIDLSSPPADQGGSRIRHLCWQGAPLRADQLFVLATNSFRGSGSGGFPVDAATVVLADETSSRDVLIAHLAARHLRDDSFYRTPDWRFCALPGTSVVFETSPHAEPYLADHPGLRMQPMGIVASGLLRVRLFL